MAGITALNNIVRQRAAFGGIMGRDGRRQYGGGSDAGADGGYGYQGGGENKKGKKGKGPASTNYGTESGTVDSDRITTSREEFEESVDRRKLKRPEDDLIGPQGNYPGSLYYTGVPKSNIPYFGKYLNMTRPLRNKGLRKNIDYFLELKSRNPNLDYEDTLEGYKEYMADRLSGSITASGNTIYNAGGNNNTSIPLYAENTIGTNIGGNLEEDETEEFAYRMGDEQNVGRDVTLGYAANGGRITRAGGGIMNVVPRQGYFLGKIVKGVGKAIGSVADAAGKVLKSDVGKMALLAAGAYYTGGALGGTGGFNNFATLGSKAMQGAKFLGKKALFTDGALDFGKAAILGASALPFFMKQPEDPDIGMADRGGRLIDPITGEEGTPQSMRDNIEIAKQEAAGDPIKLAQLNQKYNNMLFSNLPYENYGTYAQGGRIKAQEGGLMNLGGMEKDYRNEGGFVPIGKQEKADDVPARLSVNEFVFTADAVRNAGGGDIDKGAEVMENMMKNLENGGRVSEESQGNTGVQEMFSVSERIGEVI